MNIHLIPAEDSDEELYTSVVALLNNDQGPLKIIFDEKKIIFSDDEKTQEKYDKLKFGKKADVSVHHMAFDERKEYFTTVSWDSIFNKCESYRSKKNLAENEWVILLTPQMNDKNWFSAFDPSGKLNGFVHTDQWENFIPADPKFPVTYEIVSLILQRMIFDDYAVLKKHVHEVPRGCMNDYCQNKMEVTFKLRTADICHDCQELISKKKIDPHIISQVLRTMENIRKQMLFRERFLTTLHLPRMSIRGPLSKIYFDELDCELKLTPLERTIYLLFLNHPEGIHLSSLTDHEKWIEETYKRIGNPRTVADLRNSMQQLMDKTENSVNEKISRIRRKLTVLLGEDVAEAFVIKGERGEKKSIEVDRELVEYVTKDG